MLNGRSAAIACLVGLLLASAACGEPATEAPTVETDQAAVTDKPVFDAAPVAGMPATAPKAEPDIPAGDTEGVRSVGGNVSATVSSLTASVSDLKVRVTDVATIVELPADVLFEFDKATLTSAAETSLLQVADLIRRGGEGPIEIVGHTDAKGSDAYNDDLSTRRAQAVANWMAGQVGVRQRTFEVVGKGESEPVAPNETADGNDDREGRAKNRRVEVVIPRG